MPQLSFFLSRRQPATSMDEIDHKMIDQERKKIIISTSFSSALRHCGVHLLPMMSSLTIVTLNLKGYYIGASFAGFEQAETLALLLLQVAAKVQELLIVASLATIIFHITRHELLYGDGLPLGLIGSGLKFSNTAYFFTKEFYGSLRYRGNFWRKTGALSLLVVAGLIASLAGPSSAVLLVPKTQPWKAGGTSFYMNGSSDDFWPIRLEAKSTGNHSFCSDENATAYGICPSGGFHSLWTHFGEANMSNYRTVNPASSYAKMLSGSTFYWPIKSPSSQIPPLYTLGGTRSDEEVSTGTFLVQPHAATTIMLQQIMQDWWNALLAQTKYTSDQIDDRQAASTVRSPITQTRCSAPQNMSAGHTVVDFPTISGWSTWDATNSLAIPAFINTSATDHIRFNWIHLPDEFGPASIGSVFESPWTSDNTSRVVIACTIQSAWVPTTLYTGTYNFWSGWYPWDIQFGERFPSWVQPQMGTTQSPTNGRIAIDDSWLNMLTPLTPSKGPGYYAWNPTTMESILMNAGFGRVPEESDNRTATQAWRKQDLTGTGSTMFLEAIICSVFEDGVARSGSHRMYNIGDSTGEWSLSSYHPKPDFATKIMKGQDALITPNISTEITKLRVDMTITGYAYQGSLAEHLAMAVLLAHFLLAIFHILWLLGKRESSNSWESISELVALAQNSRPAFHTLKNMAAGIHHSNAFSQLAKIRVKNYVAHGLTDHVEMIFVPSAEIDHEQIEFEQSQYMAHMRSAYRRSTDMRRENDTLGIPTSRSSSPSSLWSSVYSNNVPPNSGRNIARKAVSVNSASDLLCAGMDVPSTKKDGMVEADYKYG